jgi:hypothetical protein
MSAETGSLDVHPLIVLRFRDIEVGLGESVRLHDVLIREAGYCWWGWLYRPIEKNPHEELRRLDETLSTKYNSGYQLALYDTGRTKLYAATCQKIVTAKKPRRSPEAQRTPNYYRGKEAPAWFRLSHIGEVATEMVVGRTCAAMPSLGEDCWQDILGCTIKDIRELRRQEATLWVLE